MHYLNTLRWAVLSAILFFFITVQSISAQQITTVKGIVRDASTNEILPLSNIFFKGTTIGGYSELNGTFELQTTEPVDTLIIKQIGYKDFAVNVNPGSLNEFDVLMDAEDITLGEIVVLPGENPAHPIIRNIIKNKKRNNPENFPKYNCQTYSQIISGISNISDEKEKKTLLKKLGKSLPGIKDSLGKKYIPLFITEQLAESSYNRETGENKLNIISSSTNGISVSKDLQIDGYTEALSEATNFYSNNLVLLDKSFISPISSSGFLHYKYYLEDSIQIDNKWEYRIRFKPKRKKDYAFTGELKVITNSWALTYISVQMPKNTNINFLTDFEISYEFQPVNDSTYFFKENRVKADFEYNKSPESKNKPLITVQKTTLYDKISISEQNDTAILNDEEYHIPRQTIDIVLDKYRNEGSLGQGQQMEHLIDSINKIWWVKQLDKLTSMFLTGYYNIGKIEIGPYLDMLKRNKVEDTRFILTGRTAESFSHNFSVSAKVGYGTLDKEFKYGGELDYKFNSNLRQVIGIGYEHNMITIGNNRNIKLIKENMLATGEDNWIASVINRKENDKLAMADQAYFYTQNELRRGVSTKISLNYDRFYAGKYVPFIHDDTEINYFYNISGTLGIRLSFNEKTADKYFRRYYLGSKAPIINLLATIGQYEIDNEESNYIKLHATIKHNFNIGITHFQYVLEAGHVFGDLPFPLLEVHRGNESYANSRYRFNLLDNMTLASDQYISLMTELHFNGMFFNRLPLIRRTNLREVVSAKILYGSLRNSHNNILTFPAGLRNIEEPYIELGAGVENIFKLFRIESIWRVKPVEMENSLDFGVRISMNIAF